MNVAHERYLSLKTNASARFCCELCHSRHKRPSLGLCLRLHPELLSQAIVIHQKGRIGIPFADSLNSPSFAQRSPELAATEISMAGENSTWTSDDARTTLLDAQSVVTRKVKSIWEGFTNFALRDSVMEVALGLMYVPFCLLRSYRSEASICDKYRNVVHQSRELARQ